MQNPTKILLGSFGVSLFLGDITFAAWGAAIAFGMWAVTSWNAGKGQFKPWEKSYRPRTSWVRAKPPEDQLKALTAAHQIRLKNIRNCGLGEVQKRALIARAEREYQSQIQNLL